MYNLEHSQKKIVFVLFLEHAGIDNDKFTPTMPN